MNFLNLNSIKNKFYELRSFQIFILSFSICLGFYIFEGLLGFDRFYHPDSSHYLLETKNYQINIILSEPKIIFYKGYYILASLLNYNYYLLIALNFFLYSLTNVFIYQKVYKRYFYSLSNTKLICLFYLFFLDPYRLHLASHILKETTLIFLIIIIILAKIKTIKLLFILMLEVFRKNSWIYLLIFLTYSNIKKILKPKIIYIISFLLISLLVIFFLIDQNFYNLIQMEYERFTSIMRKFNNRQMPVRSFDHVTQFKDFNYPIGFILKNITWPILLISGFFMLFVSSILFKFLGMIIILNNLLIYYITKKTFISIGLIIILLMISMYTSSYTAMFRYSYIAIYSSIIYFFLNLKVIK